MPIFEVFGPYEIPWEKRASGRRLCYEGFWKSGSPASHLAGSCGCYIFAIRNRATVPVYVGKATVNFEQEVFNPSNRHKYSDAMLDYSKGTPLMYFVVHPAQRGRNNGNQISQIEDFLIQAAAARNPDNLQNIRGAQRPKWGISGVIRGGKGKPSNIERGLSLMLGIKRRP